MLGIETLFPRELLKLEERESRLFFRDVAPGTLLSLTLGQPGHMIINLLVGQRLDSPVAGQLIGVLQPGTILSSATEGKLKDDGFYPPYDDVPAAILGGCTVERRFEQAFYQATNSRYLAIGQSVLWTIGRGDGAIFILSPSRIQEMAIRAK